MPLAGYQVPFGGQSVKGMELDVKLQSNGNDNYATLFAATAFDVQVAAATTSRQHTLNAGSRTSTGAAGEITATCDVFVVSDSPGQFTINQAHGTGEKVNVRRTLFGSKVGESATLAASNTIAIAAATGIATGRNVPKTGGKVTFTTATGTSGDTLRALKAAARPGMTLAIGTNLYFVDYKDDAGEIFVSAPPDDAESAAKSLMDPARAGADFPLIATATAGVSSGSAQLYNGRVQQQVFTGTVTVPIVPTDAAPGDDGNDLSTAQVSFALDDLGVSTWTLPA